jgi:hypothetical protein
VITRVLVLAVLAGVGFYFVLPRFDRPRDDAEGPGLVVLEECVPDELLDTFASATGTIENDTDQVRSYAIRVLFEDEDGVRAGDGVEFVQALDGGDTARWEVNATTVGPGAQCSVETRSD